MQQSDADRSYSNQEIIYIDQPDYLVFNKRAGFRTHKVSENQWGFVEVLQAHLQKKLFVVHRLDKGTSGLIVFAKSAEAAKKLSHQFENHQVKKKYHFLTEFPTEKTEFTIESHIEKVDKSFVNSAGKNNNSKTDFKFIKKINSRYSLWEATPLTGKPHQIRLHAEKAGLAILGDTEHGGHPWFRLALHASEIQIDQQTHQSDLPFCFLNPSMKLGEFIANEYHDLKKLIHIKPQQTYRIYHRTNHEQEIRADLYGSIIWVYWYKEAPPTDEDLVSLEDFCQKNNYQYVIRHMINRGQGVGGLEHKDLYYSTAPEKWIAQENKIHCELRRDQGFSPGLFLDQRSNRALIYQSSKNKKVLNLFSYTSVFSVAAALGQAQQVTTVDASKNFLEWSKNNFLINQLDPMKYEFFAQDSLLFLKGSVHRHRQWDIIICDPPSFGRTKTTTWKIEKNLSELIQLMWACLNQKGFILFTCNYEKWTLSELEKHFTDALAKQKFEIKSLPVADLDFEFPDAFDNLLKGFIVYKK